MQFVLAILRKLASHHPVAARRRRPLLRFEPLEDRSLLTAGPSTVWLEGSSVNEVDGYAMFTISCSHDGGDVVSVQYQTADGSAAAGSDFSAASGTLTFASSGSVKLSIAIIDDVLTEGDETFSLGLFNPSNATLTTSQAQATIASNDHPPLLEFIPDQTVDEGETLSFGAFAYDSDVPEETIVYSLESGAPSGMTIDASGGGINWAPQEVHGPGVFTVTVRATECASLLFTAQSLSVTVNEVNAAPTSTYPADVVVNEDAANSSISILSAFDDAEDGANGLTYAVVGSTDAELLSSASIDASGVLTLDYAENEWGLTTLTIRATDRGGLTVETTMFVRVVAVNDAPVVSGFAVTHVSDDAWVISGSVSDVDDYAEGTSLQFGGVLANFTIVASVDSSGNFAVEVDLPGLVSGDAQAWIFDVNGLKSAVEVAVVTVI